MNLRSSLPLLSLCFLIACNSATKPAAEPSTPTRGGPSSDINQNEVAEADGSNIKGIYAGELIPVNYNLHFKNVGMAGVQRDGDLFQVTVNLKNGPKKMVHKQAIYTGRRCPNLNDDRNKDAYIDMNEAMVAIGQVSIPLDEDLESQDLGRNRYPMPQENGKYFYQKSASFERMFADLKATDMDPEDNIIKLDPDEGLTLPGRVLIIQGIAESVLLPNTIAVDGERSPHEILPVACAVLWKVKEMPEDLIGTPTGSFSTGPGEDPNPNAPTQPEEPAPIPRPIPVPPTPEPTEPTEPSAPPEHEESTSPVPSAPRSP